MATRTPRTRPWTRADLARLPDDGNRYEVLDGELLVTPQAAFGHQEIAMRIAIALRQYCERHRIGIVVGPGAIPFGKSELQPDVQVIPGVDHPRDSAWEHLPLPILVVEVLSDSTRRRDLGKKADAYMRFGIPAYWAVDHEGRSILAWRKDAPDGAPITDVVSWQPRPDVPALELSLRTLFA